MKFEVREKNFYLNGNKVFLNSGEIHYFRIERDLWDTHLQAAKEAGLNAVSTYVPWAWHEAEESVFDFDGASCPERDLKGWLQRCQAHGLYCIVKPGPFILAETRGAGLPDWLLDTYADQIKMRNSRGVMVPSDGVGLFHPVYLEKVNRWYDAVMPLIRDQEISAGGPVIMMQVCNEIGVFSWLAHQGDYSDITRKKFTEYLHRVFPAIEDLNKQWGTTYSSFKEVELPPDGREAYASRGDRSRDHVWHYFWRRYYGDYLRMLAGIAREHGVSVPFYHNLPGWIYGHGYEFPVNITMYEDLYGDKSDIIFGVDHIPEFLSYRNMHDDRIINDITAAMQGNKPLFAAEFQCGSREYHVVTNPRELELFYKASIAHGLSGWNYYMFSQGRNPSRRGYSGDTFYWFNPLSPEGSRSSTFPLVKRMSSIIDTSEQIILEAERRAEIAVLFYPPYYATELERPAGPECELTFNAAAIRRPAYFDGLLKVLQILNVDYDMIDHCRAEVSSLKRYKQIWAFSTDEMNARDQQVMVDYAIAGGKLVIFPCLPDREMTQEACTIIRDALAVYPLGIETIDSPLIDILDHKDIKCANPQLIYDEDKLGDASVIARTIKGSVCGFRKNMGAGSILHLGAWLGFDTEGHKPVYESILEMSGAKLRQAATDNDYLIVRERLAEDGAAMLFVANYYNEDQMGKIWYSHPRTGEHIPIPYSGESLLWPALHGVLTPVGLNLREGISILHCTSDLLGVTVKDDHIILKLWGHRDLPGEIVFEGENAQAISLAMISSRNVSLIRHEQRLEVGYTHPHNKELTLTLILEK